MNRPFLKISNLKIQFPVRNGTVKAVDGVDCTIDRNTTVGLVGESGSGKSITALSVLRLVPAPGRIVDGQILFSGRDMLKLPAKDMRAVRGKEISMIFQEPMSSLNPVFSIGKQVLESVTTHRKLSASAARELVYEMLDRVGIPEPKKRFREYPHQFSGGQRQRIMIAMALACNPSLLIADEPTTALDVTCQAQILDLIQGLQEKQQTSVVLISHDLGVVAEMARQVLVMYAGTLMESGDVRTLFKHPAHPYTRALLKAIPYVQRRKTSGRLNEIPGMIPSLMNLPEGCRYHPRCQRAEPVCAREEPPLKTIEEGHWARCWFV